MKAKIYILTIFTMLFITSNTIGQEEEIKKSQIFDIIHIDGKLRKNQLLLEFLSKNSRFGGRHLKKMIEIQRNTNGGDYNTQNLSNNREIGVSGGSIDVIYFDGDIIFGEGINRLYLIDQTRLREIKTIKKRSVGINREIYITSMGKS